MWGFWWIFPVIGLVLCLVFMVAVVRMIAGGGHVMCMGMRQHEREETARLRREVEELRAQVNKPSA